MIFNIMPTGSQVIMTPTRSKVKVMRNSLVTLFIIISTVSQVFTSTVCNTKENGQFKCECMEISNGQMNIDCSTDTFDEIPPEGFPRETTVINLIDNNILQLKTNDFISAPHLQQLLLNENEIEVIQPNAFRGLTSLVNITINNNYLTSIETDTFRDLIEITNLDLRANDDLATIARDAFYFMPNLKTVNLDFIRLECDCEAKALRTWARHHGVSLAGAKCSNFIKSRDLADIPDNQFGDCPESPPQTCNICKSAPSLSDCNMGQSKQLCGEMEDSCQVIINVTSGQQVLTSKCQEASKCIADMKQNNQKCTNGQYDQSCTFCCTGADCTKDINLKGYTYITSMVISFTMYDQFDTVLLDSESEDYYDLLLLVTRRLRPVLAEVADVKIRIEYFRPSLDNYTTVTVHTESVWDLSISSAHVQETIFRILNTATSKGNLNLDILDESIMVYPLGYCEGVVTSSVEGELNWPNTAFGIKRTIPCPYPGRRHAVAKRDCISIWHDHHQIEVVTWSDADISECVPPSNVTDDLKKLTQTPVKRASVSDIVKDLKQLTSYDMSTTDLEYASVTLEGVMEAGIKIDAATSRDVLLTYNNLFNLDVELLQQSQQGFMSVERTLKALDNFASILEEIPSEALTEGSLSIGIVPMTQTGETYAFQVKPPGDDGFQSDQVTLSINGSSNMQEDSNIIYLPPAVLDRAMAQRTHAQFVAFSDDKFFRALSGSSNNNNGTIETMQFRTPGSGPPGGANNTIVLAASVGGLHIENLVEPVVIRFIHKQKGGKSPTCVFWDFSTNKDGGAWSSRGCQMVSHVDDDYTVCECNHMTNFALLMDIYNEGGNLAEGHQKALSMISYIGCAISLAALLITILAYSISRKLHKDNPSKLLLNLCVALSMVLILFIVVTQPAVRSNPIACKVTAGVLHYFLLSTWTWMAVEAFYMYLTLIKIFKTYISRFIMKTCLVGWGVPAIIVIITVAISTDHYGENNGICWLAPIPFYWSCLTPIGIVLVANFVVFSMVIHQLRKLSTRKDHRTMKHFGIKTQLRGSVAVCILLGLTWVFAIFAVGKASLVFQYLFCIFNSLQGLFIFIFYCLMKKDVKDLWREKWSEFTSTASSSMDRPSNRGDKYLSSRGSIPQSTLTTDSPRITTVRRTDDTLLSSSTEDQMDTICNGKHEHSRLTDSRYT